MGPFSEMVSDGYTRIPGSGSAVTAYGFLLGLLGGPGYLTGL